MEDEGLYFFGLSIEVKSPSQLTFWGLSIYDIIRMSELEFWGLDQDKKNAILTMQLI